MPTPGMIVSSIADAPDATTPATTRIPSSHLGRSIGRLCLLQRRLPTIFASGADDRRRSRRGLVAATRDSYRLGVEELETIAPPADLDAREITVTLAQSGPRYVSADREFAVWSATVGEGLEGEPVTLAGPLGQVNAGERLVCSGVFSQHPRYGWQFAVETFRSALPQSREGIVLWLKTRVPGIGPAFANAIVRHFGAEEVFAELDHRPERLREVRTRSGRAISRASVERVIAAWREVATIREVETFLFTHGISAGLATGLVRRYGDEIVAVLTQDPYRLVELPRVGFKIADRVARSLGVEPDDPQRLQAGLRFVLEE